MMHRWMKGVIIGGTALALFACSSAEPQTVLKNGNDFPAATAAPEPVNGASLPDQTQEDAQMQIQLSIGGKSYPAVLYDNETARAFAAQLPLTLTMKDLHSNEKYFYFDRTLPTAETAAAMVRSGDIKLFGDSCVVLFYQDFATSYVYTDIGHIEAPDGLAEQLGSGEVTIAFEQI